MNEVTCCFVSREHLRFGDARDLMNSIHVLFPFQNGSSFGISMGKHIFGSYSPGSGNKKIFRHAEYESARRDLNFFMGKELELLVF